MFLLGMVHINFCYRKRKECNKYFCLGNFQWYSYDYCTDKEQNAKKGMHYYGTPEKLYKQIENRRFYLFPGKYGKETRTGLAFYLF